MDEEARRAVKLELATAEAEYEEAKRRHERSLAARVRSAGYAESRSDLKGAYIDESVESEDSAQTAHELREAELKLKELQRQAAELLDDDTAER